MTVEDKVKYDQLKEHRKEIVGLSKNRPAGETPLDLRLEVILAELTYLGLDPLRDVLIHAWSLFERDYRNDVDLHGDRVVIGDARSLDKEKERVKIGHPGSQETERVKPEWDYDDLLRQNVFLNLVAHRDGLYDYLPEGLFHQPINKTRDRDQSDWSKEIEGQFRREQAARRFFQPIEQEFYHQRLLLEFEERKYLLTEENLRQNDQGEVLRTFWQLPSNLLNVRQLNNMLHLLPIAHRIVGDSALVTQAFNMILGVPVELAVLPPIKYPIELEKDASLEDREWIGPVPGELGRIALGNFALGGVFQDTMPALEIRVGPLTTQQIIDFLPGKGLRKLLDLLVGYFIAAETTVVTHLIPDDSNKYLKLSDQAPTSVLGYAAYI